jgi:anaphase-promoting complex subunit 1
MQFHAGHRQIQPVGVYPVVYTGGTHYHYLVIEHLDNRIPVWPPDMSALFYGNISNPDWKNHRNWPHHGMIPTDTTPSYAYGRIEPFKNLDHLTSIYKCLSDENVSETQKRAENAIHLMVYSPIEPDFVDRLPLGIAAPIREAARTCQLSPPFNWSLTAYRTIGRNDLAACATDAPDILFNDGYRTVKDYIVRVFYTNHDLF